MSPDNVAYIAIELGVTSWLVAARLLALRSRGCIASKAETRQRCSG
jgi:hypothetical protein